MDQILNSWFMLHAVINVDDQFSAQFTERKFLPKAMNVMLIALHLSLILACVCLSHFKYVCVSWTICHHFVIYCYNFISVAKYFW